MKVLSTNTEDTEASVEIQLLPAPYNQCSGSSRFVFFLHGAIATETHKIRRFRGEVSPLDLGVDPKKSTGVDLGVASRVGSILSSLTDPKSNLYTRNNLTSEVDLCKSTQPDFKRRIVKIYTFARDNIKIMV